MRYIVTWLVTLLPGLPLFAQPCPTCQQVTYYTYPSQKIVNYQAVAAPVVVAVPVEAYAYPVQAFNLPYYYSVGEAYREKAYLRDVIREELRNALAGGQQAPAPVMKAPERATAPEKASWLADDVTPLELQQQVLNAYAGRANCLGCHTAKESGGLRLALDDGKGGYILTKLPGDKRWKIYGMASTGLMPPTAANDASKAMEGSHLPALLQYARIRDH